MRTPKTRQSALRNPLNELLATEAKVRLVRVLAIEADGPISSADAAGRAELSLPGTTAALRRLVRTGFVARVGGGRSAQYELREGEPLMPAIRDLFRAEQLRHDEFIARLRDACVGLPEIRAAWIEGMPTASGEPLEVRSLVEIDSVSWVKQELRARLEPLERDYDILIELLFHTEADIPAADSQVDVLLAGVLPQDAVASRPRSRSHSDADARALRMAAGLAHLLEQNPSLVRAAKTHIDRLLHEGQGSSDADLLEWRRVLDTYSIDRLRHLMTSGSSRAERLRQSSPFFAVLSPRERDVLTAYLDEHR